MWNPALRTGLAMAFAATLGVASVPAYAGCGCDHPPPAWSVVMPPFASPGHEMRLDAQGTPFTVGSRYDVEFGSAGVEVSESVVAESPDALIVALPAAVPVGPVEIEVRGRGDTWIYEDTAFTALPAPLAMAEVDRVRGVPMRGAVAADGTLLLPMDLSAVLAPMQFGFELGNVPLVFGSDGVVFYNADGVDLTLFTLSVSSDTEKQWGSYYGWEVEGDSGLGGDVYEHKVLKNGKGDETSDFLTYWRHEFYTYAIGHQAGGTHEVTNGYHPDGTLHIDHDHVVLALSGALRDTSKPALEQFADQPLRPGAVDVELRVVEMLAESPVEPATVYESLIAYFGLDGAYVGADGTIQSKTASNTASLEGSTTTNTLEAQQTTTTTATLTTQESTTTTQTNTTTSPTKTRTSTRTH